ncbi:MAG: serine/threonine protein kinase, partial [Symploca sp. SIO2E6]|nr:serine/threonine protein kinase [Symploca sp. SIO2E6]
SQIAQENNYTESYLKQFVGRQTWQLLSEALGKKVNKHNSYLVLNEMLKDSPISPKEQLTKITPTTEKINLEFWEGQVPLTSSFYIERPPVELTCYQEIIQPGSWLCIEAPKKMGKTSLLSRILAYGQYQYYQTVRLNLAQAGTENLTSIKKLLRWLCANVSLQLGLEPKLDDYWHDDLGNLVSCSIYFQEYLLQQTSHPIILALDELELVFEYNTSITRDFLALLHSWHEETKDISVWSKLRMVVAYSTDIYLALATNKSPGNLGLAIELPPFTPTQVEDLAQRHELKLSSSEIEQLLHLTGGFPYLLRLALAHQVRHNLTVENVWQNATSDTGIFSAYLHYQLSHLQQHPDLADAFTEVITATSTVRLELEKALKLKGLGLVQLGSNNQATVSCDLYRRYFY